MKWRETEKKRKSGETKGGKNERDKETGTRGQVTDQDGEKGTGEEGEIAGPGKRGRLHRSTAPNLPASLQQQLRKEEGEAGEEAKAAVTLETEPGRWVRGDRKDEGLQPSNKSLCQEGWVTDRPERVV